MLSRTPWSNTCIDVRRVMILSAPRLMTLTASFMICLFFMKSLAVYGTRIMRSREPFVEMKDCTVRGTLVRIFDIKTLLIVFLRIA